MKRIVVGVDGSDPSLHAVRLAAELAAPSRSALLLVYVKRPILIPTEGYAALIAGMRLRAEEEAQAVFAPARAEAERFSVPVDTRSLEGSPAEVLVDVAAAEDAGLLVVGNRGAGAASRVLLGSVSDRAVHISKVPVLVVR